jgi:hypothetical protein
LIVAVGAAVEGLVLYGPGGLISRRVLKDHGDKPRE